MNSAAMHARTSMVWSWRYVLMANPIVATAATRKIIMATLLRASLFIQSHPVLRATRFDHGARKRYAGGDGALHVTRLDVRDSWYEATAWPPRYCGGEHCSTTIHALPVGRRGASREARRHGDH